MARDLFYKLKISFIAAAAAAMISSPSSALELCPERGDGGDAGWTRSSMDRSHISASDFEAFLAMRGRSAPAKFDLREHGATTPAKLQQYGDCWSFSAIGSVESIYKKMTGNELDLSELHLSWFAINAKPGFAITLSSGANDNIATAMLARWAGPVLESSLPYATKTPSGVFSDYPRRLRLKEAIMLDLEHKSDYNKSNDDIRKQLIMEHGAVSIGVNTSSFDSSLYYSAANNAGYNDTLTRPDHAVLICGWDDNFPKERFNEGKRPPTDGAWLIKNSRGQNKGESGFFWLSYHDVAICDGVAFICEDLGSAVNNYGWDELGWSWSAGNGSEQIWMANVFSTGSGRERLESVGFYTTASNAEYEVFFLPNADAITDASASKISVASGKQIFSGYHTVDLASPIDIEPESAFAVAVRLRTPGYDYPLPIETAIDGVRFYDGVVAHDGESFVSDDGKRWARPTATVGTVDRTVNVCLRAFTSGAVNPSLEANVRGDGPPPPPSSGGGSGGCAAGASVAAIVAAIARRSPR